MPCFDHNILYEDHIVEEMLNLSFPTPIFVCERIEKVNFFAKCAKLTDIVLSLPDADVIRSEANMYSLYFVLTGILVGGATFFQASLGLPISIKYF